MTIQQLELLKKEIPSFLNALSKQEVFTTNQRLRITEMEECIKAAAFEIDQISRLCRLLQ